MTESAREPDQVPDQHPEDPVGSNPVPEGHPAHRVWEDATQKALEEVYRLNERMLGLQPGPEGLPSWSTELAFLKYQIWANRNLCIVRNRKDARAYEQWLDNYMQAWIDSIGGKFPDAIPQLKAQLLRVCNYWKGNAWSQVRAFGLRSKVGPNEAFATGSASTDLESDHLDESREVSAGASGSVDPARLQTSHVTESAEGVMDRLPSWKELRADFLEHAVEHANLRAVWRWMYEDADESADPPDPKGQWALDGGSPGSQYLFRVVAERAAARLSNPSKAESWRLWLGRMRAEDYARDLPPRRVSMQEMRNLGELGRPLPPGFKTQYIEHVFRASADFCFARSLAEVSTASSSPVADEAGDGQKSGAMPPGGVDLAGVEATAERAARRQAVVSPILANKRWKRGRLVTEAGVGKNSVYEYLDGTRAKITDENRKAIAQALELEPEQLPD